MGDQRVQLVAQLLAHDGVRGAAGRRPRFALHRLPLDRQTGARRRHRSSPCVRWHRISCKAGLVFRSAGGLRSALASWRDSSLAWWRFDAALPAIAEDARQRCKRGGRFGERTTVHPASAQPARGCRLSTGAEWGSRFIATACCATGPAWSHTRWRRCRCTPDRPGRLRQRSASAGRSNIHRPPGKPDSWR